MVAVPMVLPRKGIQLIGCTSLSGSVSRQCEMYYVVRRSSVDGIRSSGDGVDGYLGSGGCMIRGDGG